jgi:hypothetical protein
MLLRLAALYSLAEGQSSSATEVAAQQLQDPAAAVALESVVQMWGLPPGHPLASWLLGHSAQLPG